MVEVVAPTGAGIGWREVVEAMRRRVRASAFDPLAVELADAVSRTILTGRQYRAHTEIMVLGHWLRRAHLAELERSQARAAAPGITRARGVTLHFAPGNVDTIFAYSWFLSMLAGNANVVRLSSRPSEQVDLLLAILAPLLAERRFEPIAADTLVLRYGYDEAVSAWLSQRCDLRVIWGSDESVRAIRAIALAPLATELAFPDRFSLAALDASRVAAAGAEELEALVRAFFNDVYGFSQLACSSPRLVAWVGNAPVAEAARVRFWTALESHWRSRGAPGEPALAARRLVAAMRLAARGEVDRAEIPEDGGPQSARLAGHRGEFREVHSGGGLFLESRHDALADVASILADKDQTLAAWGFGREALEAFARGVRGRAIDRIVAVGRALEFSPHWDGHDLLRAMSRVIEIDV